MSLQITLDTSGEHAKVAVHDAAPPPTLQSVVEVYATGEHHAGANIAGLPKLISRTLDDAAASLADVSRFAVIVGPGRWSALRIGIAFIGALAWARGVPVFGLPKFALIAYACARGAPPLPSEIGVMEATSTPHKYCSALYRIEHGENSGNPERAGTDTATLGSMREVAELKWRTLEEIRQLSRHRREHFHVSPRWVCFGVTRASIDTSGEGKSKDEWEAPCLIPMPALSMQQLASAAAAPPVLALNNAQAAAGDIAGGLPIITPVYGAEFRTGAAPAIATPAARKAKT